MEESSKSKGTGGESDCIELELLVIGKKAGLSFEEINLLRVRDLIQLANIYTGAEKKKPRRAGQEDIDKLFI